MSTAWEELAWLLKPRNEQEIKVWVVDGLDEEKGLFRQFRRDWDRLTAAGRRKVRIQILTRKIVSDTAEIRIIEKHNKNRLAGAMHGNVVEVINGDDT